MDKRKRINLTINQKLEIIQKLESGMSVAHICEQYGIKKQTVSDIKKNKSKINKFTLMCDVGENSNPRKRMKLARETSLEEAILKWYGQQRSCGVPVRAVELKSAAIKLANHMNIPFRASDGWLWRFRKRHGIMNKRIYGEASSAPKEEIEPFRQKLIDHINNEMLLESQIYNADETALLWRTLPESTQASKYEKSNSGRKISKDRISVLLCANADGSHRLTPVIVGKSRKPRVLKDIMHHLPVSYYNSNKAWFNSDIFKNWFLKEFIPTVRNFQEKKLGIPPEEVKCLLILDNAPAHPSENILRSEDGNFNSMFLPKNTTSLIQPMDQGIILATKRIYRRKFLDEVMVVLQNEDNAEDTRGQRTLQNLKCYNLKSTIFNFAAAWKEVKEQTLKNGWKNLFDGQDADIDLEGLEVSDFCRTIHNNIGGEVAEEDILEWLEVDEGDPGYNIMTESEIADEVMNQKNEDGSEDSEEEETTLRKIKLSVVRSHLDDLITFIDYSSDNEIQLYYTHFRNFRELIIKKQRTSKVQTKLDSFFKVGLPKVSAPISNSNVTSVSEGN